MVDACGIRKDVVQEKCEEVNGWEGQGSAGQNPPIFVFGARADRVGTRRTVLTGPWVAVRMSDGTNLVSLQMLEPAMDRSEALGRRE